jgi:mannose-6-phosphate isomerase-like protein (cupin superfamily)
MKNLIQILGISLVLLASPTFGQTQQPKPQPPPQTPAGQKPATPPQTGQKPAPPPQSRGAAPGLTLTVDVTDMSGNALSGVRVSADGPAERDGETTQGGTLVFRSMRAGTYRLRFEHTGFITLEREVVIRPGQSATVSTALNAAPVKPAPTPAPAPPPAAPTPTHPTKSARTVEPRTLSIPDFLDRNLIGGEPQRTTLLACADGGTARLLQVRDPLTEPEHAEFDEILYVVAGAGVVRIRNVDTKMQPGHFALVPRGVPHSVRREGRNPIILLSVLAGTPCTDASPPAR